MADTKISALTDGTTAADTDRIPIARSPFGSTDNRYLTPLELLSYITTPTSSVVVPGYIIGASTSTLSLTSTTSSQKLFNMSTNGAVAVAGSTTYLFEVMFSITGLSATSGNCKFDLLGAGTATITSQAYLTDGLDASTLTTAGAGGISYNTASPSVGNIVTAATGTGVAARVHGIVRVNAAGTLIPSVALTTANTGTVGINAYLWAFPIGSNTVTTVGTWT